MPYPKEIKIGSSKANDIQLDGRYIDDFHAVIKKVDDQYFLEDLSSTFGTYIGEQRISNITKIKPGTMVRIGTALIDWYDFFQPEPEVKQVYFADLFDPRGTVDKVNYRFIFLIFCISPIIICFGVPGILALVEKYINRGFKADLIDLDPYISSFWVLCSVIVIYIIIVQTIKRIKDIKKPLYLFLIPFYNLYLLLYK